MNKAEIVEYIAKECNFSRKRALQVLDVILDIITKTLKKGERITLTGFGEFSVVKRSRRTGRNPMTGSQIKIPARKVIRFKTSKTFSEGKLKIIIKTIDPDDEDDGTDDTGPMKN